MCCRCSKISARISIGRRQIGVRAFPHRFSSMGSASKMRSSISLKVEEGLMNSV
jgi:hypothetical protein